MYKKLKWYHFLIGSLIGLGLLYVFIDSPEDSDEIPKLSSEEYDVPIGAIVIDKLNPHSYTELDSILDTVGYVPMETSEESIIGAIDELIITDSYILILDRYQTQSIFIFNRAGTYIRKIHNIGQGPGEFTQPTDLIADEETDQIILLHGFPSKLIKYNFKGEYEGEIALPMRFTALSFIQDTCIALYNEPNNRKYGNPRKVSNQIYSRILVITPSGEYIHTGGSLNSTYEENIESNVEFGIMDNCGIVSFQPKFCDTIFLMKVYDHVPQLVVDFEDHTIDQKMVAAKSIEEFKHICFENDFYYLYGRHNQTEEIISFKIAVLSQNKIYQAYYNKLTNDALIFPELKVDNPFNPGNIFPLTSFRDYFVTVVYPMQIIDVTQSLEIQVDQISEENLRYTPPQEMLDRIDENSNPILCFFKLRPEKINMESVYFR